MEPDLAVCSAFQDFYTSLSYNAIMVTFGPVRALVHLNWHGKSLPVAWR